MRNSKQRVIPSVFKNCNKVLVCLTAIRTLNFWKTLTRANGVLASIIWFQWMPNEADLLCPGLPKWFMHGHFSLNRKYHPVNLTRRLSCYRLNRFSIIKAWDLENGYQMWSPEPGFSSHKIFFYSNIKSLKVKMCVLTTKEVIMAERSQVYQTSLVSNLPHKTPN